MSHENQLSFVLSRDRGHTGPIHPRTAKYSEKRKTERKNIRASDIQDFSRSTVKQIRLVGNEDQSSQRLLILANLVDVGEAARVGNGVLPRTAVKSCTLTDRGTVRSDGWRAEQANVARGQYARRRDVGDVGDVEAHARSSHGGRGEWMDGDDAARVPGLLTPVPR